MRKHVRESEYIPQDIMPERITPEEKRVLTVAHKPAAQP